MFKREPIPLAFAFELSNRCNMSQYHKECPVDSKADPVFLNTDIIKDTISYFGSVGYGGNLYFNIYNEPLIDPRLFMLLEFTKKVCGCGVTIYTNGWGLNQYIVDDLKKLNANLVVSCYSDKDFDRVSQLNNIIGCSKSVLDLRVKTIYDMPQTRSGMCRFPSVYGMINHLGGYELCCRDWKYNHILGDLKTSSIKDVLESEERTKICNELEAGVRSLDICKRCHFAGWGIEEPDAF